MTEEPDRTTAATDAEREGRQPWETPALTELHRERTGRFMPKAAEPSTSTPTSGS